MEWAITGAILLLFVMFSPDKKKPGAKPDKKPGDKDKAPDNSQPDKKDAEDKKKDDRKSGPIFDPIEDKKKMEPIRPAKDPDSKPGVVIDGIVGPEPEKKEEGPDPYEPAPIPTMGEYYQVTTGDYGDPMSGIAYGAHVTHRAGWKHRAWLLVVAAPENAWIARDPSQPWGGGLYPKYSGWKTPWASGTQHPVVFFPVLTEQQVNP